MKSGICSMGRWYCDMRAQESTEQIPTWLWGEWSRDWIQKGRVRSTAVDVHYLQTPTYFADVRIPKDRTGISAARSFAELTDAQLRLLTHQNGFTGHTTIAGAVATWHHEIDFRPSDGTPDSGRLRRIPPGRMHERGLDGSYTESWRSVTGGNGRFLVMRVERGGRLLRTLIVVGDEFLFVRNRSKDLPMAASFDALIDGIKASRDQIVEYLDCEFSVGKVGGGSVPWVIDRSTLPWREGHHLDFIEQVSIIDPALVPREVDGARWTVPVNTLSPLEIKVLFGGESNPED